MRKKRWLMIALFVVIAFLAVLFRCSCLNRPNGTEQETVATEQPSSQTETVKVVIVEEAEATRLPDEEPAAPPAAVGETDVPATDAPAATKDPNETDAPDSTDAPAVTPFAVTPTPTSTPTSTPTNTPTPTPTKTPTPTPTNTPTPTPTKTPTPTPTKTPTPTPTKTPTPTPTKTPTPTPTKTPTPTPTKTPTPTPTKTPTPKPTNTPTPKPTNTPTPRPTNTPTPKPTPTKTPTPKPTNTPTPKPTPTKTPTPKPTITQKPTPTAHVHHWIVIKKTIHHDAEYEYIEHEGYWKTVTEVKEFMVYWVAVTKNGEPYSPSNTESKKVYFYEYSNSNAHSSWSSYINSSKANRTYISDGFYPKSYEVERQVWVEPWTEKKLVKEPWDEKVPDYRYCDICGAEEDYPWE